MSRANPFGDLDDFGSDNAAKPVSADTIEKITESSGFPSCKAAVAHLHEMTQARQIKHAPHPCPSAVTACDRA